MTWQQVATQKCYQLIGRVCFEGKNFMNLQSHVTNMKNEKLSKII